MNFDPETNGAVDAIVVQSNGQIVLGGGFTALQPLLGTTVVTRNNIARVNLDGSVDSSYDPEANGQIEALVHWSRTARSWWADRTAPLQPNAALLPTTRNNLALLKTDGTVDASFDPNPNNAVNAINLQSDGSILLGGTFTLLQPNPSILIGGSFAHVSNVTCRQPGPPPTRTARPTRPWTANPNGTVNGLAVQANNQVIVGGSFSTVGGVARNNLARLNTNDTLDTTFNPNVTGTVNALAIQGNGQVVLGGSFSAVGGVARTNLARITSTGSWTPALRPRPTARSPRRCCRPMARSCSAAPSSTVDGVARTNLARINADGTLDATFNPAANGAVNSIEVLANGQIMLGGAFSTIGGSAHSRHGAA